MDFERDYILRMIKSVGQVIMKMLGQEDEKGCEQVGIYTRRNSSIFSCWRWQIKALSMKLKICYFEKLIPATEDILKWQCGFIGIWKSIRMTFCWRMIIRGLKLRRASNGWPENTESLVWSASSLMTVSDIFLGNRGEEL